MSSGASSLGAVLALFALAVTPAHALEESPAPIVLACVDRDGKLVSAEIAESSGYPELDEAALKVARAAKFTPGTGKHKPRKGKPSCIKFKVKFVIKDGEPVPAEPAAQP